MRDVVVTGALAGEEAYVVGGALRDELLGRPVLDLDVVCADPEAAVSAARMLGRPVALKLDAEALAHKSDLGLVRLGLADDDAIRSAATALFDAGRQHGLQTRGLLVEPMAEPGLELIVGLHRDPQFGPAVVVGLGGILTEVLDDVAIRLAPVTHETALAMLADLRGGRILDGMRGRPAVDRGAVADLIVAVARLGAERDGIVEIDLNPVIATPDGAVAVDALVILEGTHA